MHSRMVIWWQYILNQLLILYTQFRYTIGQTVRTKHRLYSVFLISLLVYCTVWFQSTKHDNSSYNGSIINDQLYHYTGPVIRPAYLPTTTTVVTSAMNCDPSKRIFIAISIDPDDLYTVGTMIWSTWASRSCHYIYFIVGHYDLYNITQTGLPVIQLDCANDYPPVQKELSLWLYLSENYVDCCGWFVKIDADSYLNMRVLENVLYANWNGTLGRYIGDAAPGRPHEIKYMDLHGDFCMGMGYAVHHSVLRQVGPHIPTCMQNVVAAPYSHSDTEWARCIYYNTDEHITCNKSSIRFQPVYYTKHHGIVYPRQFTANMQSTVQFSLNPPTHYYDKVIIHPIKDINDYIRFHQQVLYNIRPLHPPLQSIYHDNTALMDQVAIQKMYTWAVTEQNRSCTNNPQLQHELHQTNNKECTPPILANKPPIHELLQQLTVIVCGTPSTNVYEWLVAGAKLQYINTTAIRQCTFSGIQLAKKLDLHRVVILHNHQANLTVKGSVATVMQKLLTQNRCGGMMYTEYQGGILILDTVIQTKSTLPTRDYCHNIHTGVPSDYNVIMYHRAVYDRMLKNEISNSMSEWLISVSVDGYAVRYAYPPLYTYK